MAKKVIGDFDFFDEPGDIIDHVTRRELSADRIKAETDFLRLLDHLGVKVKKTGKNMMGLCPFHDDHNPSLSITADQKGFKCFGCGKSGDMIKFVEYYKGVKFKEALKFLSDFNQPEVREIHDTPLKIEIDDPDRENTGAVEKSLKQLINPPPVVSGVEVPPADPMPVLSEAEVPLNRITGHYQKKLNEKALSYLKSRGLDNMKLLNDFKVGFSDGSLIEILSESQQEALYTQGILRKGKDRGCFEAFGDHVIFPIMDESGQVMELYGRSINPHSNYPHLYQSGEHKGIFNCRCVKSYDEIILTESIIDALSLIQLGFNNVTASYGTNGFRDCHLKALKEGNVKTVVIAYDNDEPGHVAGEKLKKQLIEENFEVKIIFPMSCNDWNEELLNQIVKEALEKCISEAPVFKKEEDTSTGSVTGFIVKEENLYTVFTIGDLTYRIAGLKDVFIGNLKVKISAEYQGEYFPDTVDLCANRSRIGYSLTLAGRFGLEPKRIENDLIRIFRYQEEKREKKLNTDQEARELTEAEKKLGLTLLKDPGLIDVISHDITALGYVGDERSKLLIYLCATSRKLERPISVMIISASAGGKSYVIEVVQKLMPQEDVIEIDTASEQAFQYSGKKLMNKFLVMGEAVHNENIEHQLREILSRNRLTRWVTKKDEKTGEMESRSILVEAKVSSVLSTTNERVNPENASRYFIINADESISQTRAIYQNQLKQTGADYQVKKRTEHEEIIKKHVCAQCLLKDYIIAMPETMQDNLRFPDQIMRFRRDHQRFIDLIKTVCYLRQYQKEIKTFEGGTECIYCDGVDYRTAWNLLTEKILPGTVNELSQSVSYLYDAVRQMIREKAEANDLKLEETGVTQREIRETTGLDQMTVKRGIRGLVDYEYLRVKGSGQRGSRNYYYLVSDSSLHQLNINMITHPDEMDAILKAGQVGQSGSDPLFR